MFGGIGETLDTHIGAIFYCTEIKLLSKCYAKVNV